MKIEEEETERLLRRTGEVGESFCVFWTRLWEFNAGMEGKENRARKRRAELRGESARNGVPGCGSCGPACRQDAGATGIVGGCEIDGVHGVY